MHTLIVQEVQLLQRWCMTTDIRLSYSVKHI